MQGPGKLRSSLELEYPDPMALPPVVLLAPPSEDDSRPQPWAGLRHRVLEALMAYQGPLFTTRLVDRAGDFALTVGWSTLADVSPESGSDAVVADLDGYAVSIRHERGMPPTGRPPRPADHQPRRQAPPPSDDPERRSFGDTLGDLARAPLKALFGPRSTQRPAQSQPNEPGSAPPRQKPAAREPSLPDVLRDSFTDKTPPDEG